MLAYAQYSSSSEAIGSGLLVFVLCSGWGLRLFNKGLRDDICDSSGHRKAGRGWFIWGGAFLQLPFLVYLFFIWRQGYFSS